MDAEQYQGLAIIRAAIGFLGEREQYAWWQSSFFSPQSRAFLAPVFGRSQLLAQTMGVTRAASLIHDERIGVGRVFHLFRLPEDIEQGIHQALHHSLVTERAGAIITSKETALQYVKSIAHASSVTSVGPTHIGNTNAFREAPTLHTVTALYAEAFTNGNAIFPYFADQP